MNLDIINIEKDGIEKPYEVLMTFDSDNTNKSYAVYTDYTVDDNNCVRVYASTYKEENGKLKLGEVDTEYEMNYINDFLNKQQEEVNYILDSIDNELDSI